MLIPQCQKNLATNQSDSFQIFQTAARHLAISKSITGARAAALTAFALPLHQDVQRIHPKSCPLHHFLSAQIDQQVGSLRICLCQQSCRVGECVNRRKRTGKKHVAYTCR